MEELICIEDEVRLTFNRRAQIRVRASDSNHIHIAPCVVVWCHSCAFPFVLGSSLLYVANGSITGDCSRRVRMHTLTHALCWIIPVDSDRLAERSQPQARASRPSVPSYRTACCVCLPAIFLFVTSIVTSTPTRAGSISASVASEKSFTVVSSASVNFEEGKDQDRTGGRSDSSNNSNEYESAEETGGGGEEGDAECDGEGEQGDEEFDGPDTSSLTAFLLSLLSVSSSHKRARKKRAKRTKDGEGRGRGGGETGTGKGGDREGGGKGDRKGGGEETSTLCSGGEGERNGTTTSGGFSGAGSKSDREATGAGADDRERVRRGCSETSDVADSDDRVERRGGNDRLGGRRARVQDGEGRGEGGGESEREDLDYSGDSRGGDDSNASEAVRRGRSRRRQRGRREAQRSGGGGGGGGGGGVLKESEDSHGCYDDADVVDWQLVCPADVDDLSSSRAAGDSQGDHLAHAAANQPAKTGNSMSTVGGCRTTPEPAMLRSQFSPRVQHSSACPAAAVIAPPPMSDPSSILKDNHRAVLCKSLPALCRGRSWVLLYSTERHGISLHTLYRRSALIPGPTLLVVRDTKGAVFGGFASAPLKPSSRKKYQGGAESFVFKEVDGELTLYRQTAANRYFYLCMLNGFAFGGGGHFALRLDPDLLEGTSEVCDTYGSPCLASSEEFQIRTVELWGFAHTSRYSPRAFKLEETESIIFHGY
ncbi:hypothetical protein CBR_g49969 [Chara braunii]|uniref:Oxidation resistance protein 1 n=1 Tax=Chara braunii TaxID=69332 RepID=A0A388K585_CHABU|nr:hypothetical protein CBR_g49969 [Chara braunii]|eukprot:GBG65176.1 hypothetical protein CBR_g49969 [Chara braunii]